MKWRDIVLAGLLRVAVVLAAGVALWLLRDAGLSPELVDLVDVLLQP